MPALLANDLEKIDSTCEQGREQSGGPDATQAARARVLGSKGDRPDVGDTWMGKNKLECENCHAVKDSKSLLACSGFVPSPDVMPRCNS